MTPKQYRTDTNASKATAVLALALLLAAPLVAQANASLRVTIPETGAAARVRVMAAFQAAGLAVTSVAACDCALSAGPFEVTNVRRAIAQYATMDATILPDGAASVVTLSAKASGLTVDWKPVLPPAEVVPVDSTRRATKGPALLLYRVAAALQLPSTPAP
jgi:hypothetical protein